MEHSKLAFSIPEACTALSISRAKLYEEMHGGRLKKFKIGNRTLFSRTALEDYIKEREEEARSDAAA